MRAPQILVAFHRQSASYGHRHSSPGPGYCENGANQLGNDLYQATPIPGSNSTPANDWRIPASVVGASSSHPTSVTRVASPKTSAGHPRSARSESSPSAAAPAQHGRQGEGGLPDLGDDRWRAEQSLASAFLTRQSDRNMSASGGMSLPGALQPGRPAAVSSNTAPSSIPTLPPISTSNQPQQLSSPSRASTTSHSHSYSRSSPAATYPDDTHKYASTPTHKYMAAHTPQTATYSPLGLEDIRPRADLGIDDGLASANPYQAMYTEPTNCNYLAPFPVYSYDWCKWPVHQHGLGDAAGKMAIGSYLEDGHNYVSD